DPNFVGRTIRVNARELTIVGVAPKGFTGTTALIAPDVWLPMCLFDAIVNDIFKKNGGGLADRAAASVVVAGRLKPGLSIEQANARLGRLSADLERAYP